MNAIRKLNPTAGANFVEVDVPDLTPNSVLVEVLSTSVCGTDVHIFDWDEWASSRLNLPLTIGHELSGKVIEVGSNVESINRGDFISAESHITCGSCLQCNKGLSHLCNVVKLRGVDFDGCFADFALIDKSSIWVNDSNISPEIASIQEPFGNALHSLTYTDVKDETVLILGCGPIGLCAIALCRLFGAEQIFAVDISEYRLDLASKMGATEIINATSDNYHQGIMDMTNGLGVGILLELSGSPIALSEGLKLVRSGGYVSLLGLPSKNVSIDVSNNIILKGLTVQGIFGRIIPKTWEETSKLLTSNKLNLSDLITHQFKLKDFDSAFNLMKTGMCGKIVMIP